MKLKQIRQRLIAYSILPLAFLSIEPQLSASEVKPLKTRSDVMVSEVMADKMSAQAQKIVEPKVAGPAAGPVYAQDRELRKKEAIANNLRTLSQRLGSEYGFQIPEKKIDDLANLLTPYTKAGLNKLVVEEIVKNVNLPEVVKRFYDKEIAELTKEYKKVKGKKEAERSELWLKKNINYISKERDSILTAITIYNNLLCLELDTHIEAVKLTEKVYRGNGVPPEFFVPPLHQQIEHLEQARMDGIVLALSGRVDRVNELTEKIKKGESINRQNYGLSYGPDWLHFNPQKFPAYNILKAIDTLDADVIDKLNKTKFGQPNEEARSYQHPDGIKRYEDGAMNKALGAYFSETAAEKTFQSVLSRGTLETAFDPGYGGFSKYTNKDGTPNQSGVLYEQVKLMQLPIFASILSKSNEYRDPGAIAGLARAAMLMSTEHYETLIAAVGKEAEKGTLTVQRADAIAKVVTYAVPYLLERANKVIDGEVEKYSTTQKRSVSQEEANYYRGFLQTTMPEVVLSLYKAAFEGGATDTPVYGFGIVQANTKSKSLIDSISSGGAIPNQNQIKKLIMEDIKVVLREQVATAEITNVVYNPRTREYEVSGLFYPPEGMTLKDLRSPEIFVSYEEIEPTLLFKLFKETTIQKDRWTVGAQVSGDGKFKAVVPGVYKHIGGTEVRFEAFPIGPAISKRSGAGTYKTELAGVPSLSIPNVGTVDVKHNVGIYLPGGSLTSVGEQYLNLGKEESEDSVRNPFLKNQELSAKLQEAGIRGTGFEWRDTLKDIEVNQLEMLKMLKGSERFASDFAGGSEDPDYKRIMNWIDQSARQGKIVDDKEAIELLVKSNFGIQTGVAIFPEPFKVRSTLSMNIMEAGAFYEKGKWGLSVLKGDLVTKNRVTYKTVAYNEETGEIDVQTFSRDYETTTSLGGLSGRVEFDKLKGKAEFLVDMKSPTATYLLRWLPSDQKDLTTALYETFAKGWELNLKTIGKKAIDLLALPPDVMSLSYITDKPSGFSQMQFGINPAPRLNLRGSLYELTNWMNKTTKIIPVLDIPTKLTYKQLWTRIPKEQGAEEGKIELSHELRLDTQLWRSVKPFAYMQAENIGDLLGKGNVIGAGIDFDVPKTGLNVAVGVQWTDVEGKREPNYVARLLWTFGTSEEKNKTGKEEKVKNQVKDKSKEEKIKSEAKDKSIKSEGKVKKK